MTQNVERPGHNRPRIFRPLKDDFRGDLTGALATLAGVGIGALVYDSLDGFLGSVIGLTGFVGVRAIRRRVTRPDRRA